MADSHKRPKEFHIGDFVMIKLRPERFSPGTMKKLHARGAGPFKILRRVGQNAYVLELPPDFGISPTFNVSDIKEFKEPVLIPSEPFEPYPIFESETQNECPPATQPERRDRVERILDDQTITTRNKGYQRYLVRWQGRPESDDSWITHEDLQQINPDLLEKYHGQTSSYSTGSSSSSQGRIGADTRALRRLHSIWLRNGRNTDSKSKPKHQGSIWITEQEGWFNNGDIISTDPEVA